MRFVPIKSIEQQDIQALHRAREQMMRWRTALINHTRGWSTASPCPKGRRGSERR
jgi:transposase